MRLYIAGLYTSSYSIFDNTYKRFTPGMKALMGEVQHKLESYHYIAKGRYAEKMRKAGDRVFLDSGAFSSFSLGVNVNIEAYAEFVKGNQDIIEMASVLDAIGDPEGTYHNQNTMEKLGAEVLPCFHYGEPWSLCEYYLNNYEYITIGGMVPIANVKLEPWLDELWGVILTDKDGYSRAKVHGFGLTSKKLMAKYPWYSCDSSSWIQYSANGVIAFPEFDYGIHISSKKQTRQDFGQHFNTFPPKAREKVIELLTYYGLKLEEVTDGSDGRSAINAFTYDRLGRMLGDDHWRKPFIATQPLLF